MRIFPHWRSLCIVTYGRLLNIWVFLPLINSIKQIKGRVCQKSKVVRPLFYKKWFGTSADGKVISQKLNILDVEMFDGRRLPIMEKEEWWCLTNGGGVIVFT